MALTNWGKSLTRGMRLSDYLLPITVLAIVALETVIVTDVAARGIFRIGSMGGIALQGLLVAVIVFSAAGAGWREGEFVRVNLLRRRLPQRVQVVLDVVAVLLGLGCCAVLFWLSLEATIDAFNSGIRPVGHSMPMWPWKLAVPVGASFICYEMIARLIRDIRQLTHKGKVP